MNRTMLLICAVCGVLLLVAIAQPLYVITGGLYFDWTHPAPPSASAVEQAARNQVDAALPVGSTKVEVETWLDSQNLGRSEIEDQNGHSIRIFAGKSIYEGYYFHLFLRMEFDFDQ